MEKELSILILKSTKVDFVVIKYCIYRVLLLMLLCKKVFEVSLKDSLFYSISFSFGYSILGSILNYMLLACVFDNIMIYSVLKYEIIKFIALNTILLILLK